MRSFIYIHAVWTVKDEQALLPATIRKVLFVHMQQDAVNKGIQLMAVNGTEDHVHCLFKMMPVQQVSHIVKQLKDGAAFWLNENKLLKTEVEWSESYAVYSVSPNAVDKAIEYIGRQEQFHAGKTLAQELEAFDKMNAAS
ncbi:IS200/IS605 family transposase [Deminuibacter soli]|uniref:IS200/IS605 family transposase n=1 Tax=Deminuibacter soli TaxID=2291815 RepID=A0A3E1NLF3_9BACT|nr:IS200/IS605 family transposase [Deminuibacter soli]RFM28756.1 IS200/IS605 family transposase [Deminuibacter soli]